jgi:hypothetical protein
MLIYHNQTSQTDLMMSHLGFFIGEMIAVDIECLTEPANPAVLRPRFQRGGGSAGG